MTTPRLYHPGPASTSDDDLVDPAQIGVSALPASGTVAASAAPSPTRDLAGAGARFLARFLVRFFHPTQSGTGAFILQLAVLAVLFLLLGALFPEHVLLADNRIWEAALSAALGGLSGAVLFWHSHRHRRVGLYTLVHMAVLVSGLLSLSGFLDPEIAMTINLPFLAGYGLASFLLTILLAAIPRLQPRRDPESLT